MALLSLFFMREIMAHLYRVLKNSLIFDKKDAIQKKMKRTNSGREPQIIEYWKFGMQHIQMEQSE